MTYFVRSAEPAEARQHLRPLWLANLPIEGDPDDKLHWFYEDNPHGAGRTFLLERVSVSNVIGGAGIGVRTLYLRGEPLRAALFADLAVDPAHRTAFPALTLVRAVKEEVSRAFDLGYGFPNAKAVPVYRRAGCAELGAMMRYVRVLRSGEYVARYMPAPIVARAVGTLVDKTMSLSARRRERSALWTFELHWLPDADDRFDDLWQEARNVFPIICERSGAFLRWRFGRQPGRVYRIAALIERATRRLRAYAVVLDTGGVAHIVDMLAARDVDLDRLLCRLVPELERRGLHSIAVRFLGTPRVVEVLQDHGFIARKRDTRAVALAISAARARQHELHDSTLWYLTDLDEDW